MTVRELVTNFTRNGSESIDGAPTTIIEPQPGWRLINFRELWAYHDLFFFLVWRDIKVRYAQSILGVGWAVIQPVFSMIVFTIVFGNLAKVSSDGVPYAIFSYTALVPWAYFSNALTDASSSLVSSSGMLTKVYFPRLIIPLAPVLGKLVDFGIAFLLVLGLMVWFQIAPTIWVLILPLLILLMMLTAKVENLSKRYRIGLKEEMHDTFAGALTDFVTKPIQNLRRLRKLSTFEDGQNMEGGRWKGEDGRRNAKSNDPKVIIWALQKSV